MYSIQHGLEHYLCDVSRGSALRMALVVLCTLAPECAQAQSTAKVEPASVIYCSYWDRTTNDDLTGYLVDGSSCSPGDSGAAETVTYVVCDSKRTISVQRKDLKKSGSGCDGVRSSPVVASIKGEVVDVAGDKVSVAYEANTGRQVVTVDKKVLGGAEPEKNSRVIFLPTEAAKVVDLKGFAKDFEIFKSAANNPQLPIATHGVHGVVVDKFKF